EIVKSRDICVLCREILRLINKKIMDHSSRVGYILYCMLQCEGKYEDFELAEYALLGMLHDIGAFKVDSESDILKFDMTDVMPHSIYGSLFIKYLSPLGDERSKILMYHHIDYKQLEDVNLEQKNIANYLNLANMVDIYNNSIGNRFDYLRLKNYIGTKFSQEAFELCAQAQKKFDIFEKLKMGSYKAELDEVFEHMMLSDGEKNKFIELLMYISGFRDEANVINTVTSSIVAMEIADRMEGISEEDKSVLYYASILHDVGMLSVPTEIITAPRKLTAQETETMRRHVEVTDNLLRGRVNEKVADVVLAHHERGDGSGYPKHLENAQLNMPMRILQVSDTVTALTCERAYREPKPKDAVISILKNEVDLNRFHRGIVMTFVNFYDDIMAVVNKRSKEITVNWSQLNKQYEAIRGSLKK
ncbi:MAG: HD domain-containing protein, partial [Lachnospiraceae bacterium]|nr:HD domain-containing protein [Lachnospiraceae bacterium]